MITVECPITIDDQAQEIAALFDYTIPNVSTTCFPLPSFPFTYTIGYVVGSSGSGKTQLLKHLGYRPIDDDLVWDDRSLVSYFPSCGEAVERLSMAGLGSIPEWFRPFSALSAGQQARAIIARGLKSHCIIDEFTSNLDRRTARAVSSSLFHYVGKYENIIVAGCHRDIIPWLQPSWIYDTDRRQFIDSYPHLLSGWFTIFREPHYASDIDKKVLVIAPSSKEKWSYYAPHHYLTSSLLANSWCWEAWLKCEGVLYEVAFISITIMVGKIKDAVREHRLVVLPWAQGMGIGTVISETLASHYLLQGKRYYAKTTHPKLGLHRERSDLWVASSWNGKKAKPDSTSNKWDITQRVCYCHEFIGTPALRRLKPSTPSNAPSIVIEKLEWLPLRVFGVVKEIPGAAVFQTVLEHKKQTFSFASYGSREQALQAAHHYLTLQSLAKKTNVYRVIDDVVELRVENEIAMLDVANIEKIRGYYWRLRKMSNGMHAYTHTEKKRVYLGEMIYERTWSMLTYIDGNPLNNTSSNVDLCGSG